MEMSKQPQSKKSKKDEVEDEGDVYVVESVQNKRKTKDGRNEYLFKWQGFPMSEATWEPEENIGCHKLIAAFEKERSHSNKVEKRDPEAPSTSTPRADHSSSDVSRIVGMNKLPTGEIVFLIKFKDGYAELIPAKIANVKYTEHVIGFYERHVTMIP